MNISMMNHNTCTQNPLFEKLKDRFACEDNRTIGEVMLEKAIRQGYGDDSVTQIKAKSQVCRVPYVPTNAHHGSTLSGKRTAPLGVILMVIMGALLLLSLSYLGYTFSTADMDITPFAPGIETIAEENTDAEVATVETLSESSDTSVS